MTILFNVYFNTVDYDEIIEEINIFTNYSTLIENYRYYP